MIGTLAQQANGFVSGPGNLLGDSPRRRQRSFELPRRFGQLALHLLVSGMQLALQSSQLKREIRVDRLGDLFLSANARDLGAQSLTLGLSETCDGQPGENAQAPLDESIDAGLLA